MEAVLDFWLTTGRFAAAFEKSFSEFLGTRHTSLCNSGSSANLLAISCLTSPKLKDRRLQPGDEEGGSVVTNSGELKQLIESFRDWGRDCWCETGHNNTCKRRFDQQFGDLPFGYDHKYVYSHIGYNLKLTDLQAALGVSQLKKLPKFIEIRRQNFQILYEGLKNLEEFFILPEATPHSQPSWFGFPIAVRPEAPFSRHDLIRYLDQAKIDTRLLFGGNLTRQPAFQDVTYRKVGELKNSDFVMSQVFWVGVYPGPYFTLDVKRKRVYSSKYDSIICL